MTSRIILLSGRPEVLEKIVKSKTGIEETSLLSVEEKSIVRFRYMLSLVRGGPTRVVCFACKDIQLQRYHFVLKSYLFLSNGEQRFIIDESGASIQYSFVHFLGVDVPRFVLELGASLVVLFGAFLRTQHLMALLRKESFRP